MAAIAQVERLTTGFPDEMLLGEGEDFHLRTTLADAVVTGVNEAVSGMSEVLNGSFFIHHQKDSNEGENSIAAATTIADDDIEMYTASSPTNSTVNASSNSSSITIPTRYNTVISSTTTDYSVTMATTATSGTSTSSSSSSVMQNSTVVFTPFSTTSGHKHSNNL